MITAKQLIDSGLNTESAVDVALLEKAVNYANDKYWIEGKSDYTKIKNTVAFFNSSVYYHPEIRVGKESSLCS